MDGIVWVVRAVRALSRGGRYAMRSLSPRVDHDRIEGMATAVGLERRERATTEHHNGESGSENDEGGKR